MQGKILIVDAISTNRIVLNVKLKKAYYNVVQALSVAEAVDAARSNLPDLIITALDLPDGDAADLSRQLNENALTETIPILAIGAQLEGPDRLATLTAGVSDILGHPIDETLLLGRVRSLIRTHNATTEWHLREDTCRALGLAERGEVYEPQLRCILSHECKEKAKKYAKALQDNLDGRVSPCETTALIQSLAQATPPEMVLLFLRPGRMEAAEDLRLVSAIRATAKTRYAGIIVIQSAPDSATAANALDLGADDLMTDGFHGSELTLRVKAVMRRKRMAERLRASVRSGLQAAVFDPLTGLYNRRYAIPHLDRITEHARTTGRSFAVLTADLDHFKTINDRFGHASGDAVLVEVGARLRASLRAADMVARIGGEEFLMVLPGTTKTEAQEAAIRICEAISSEPFIVPGSLTPINVTLSIGMAIGIGCQQEVDVHDNLGRALMQEADRALYAAKGLGRNQVNLGRPAA